MEKILALRVENSDNVATIFSELAKDGAVIEVVDQTGKKIDSVEICSEIPYGHKIALRDIKKGEDICKYGICIGFTNSDIKKGEHVHTHNLESKRGRGDLNGKENVNGL